MELRTIEICGFKSFADRTKLSFDSGITGIVGPNGCGKSNIVDAIRWVLGEQSAKFLRSDKMENVIFNGTNARRKANFAEVSLTFENTKNILPTEYTTVTITRKLYRTGESEYMLNGVNCRLKDITNLFMDTGVSSDSYSIIELKMVEEILTNKDQERRRFLEEAAGISKYKARKKQTIRKLEETDADLVRVEDLQAEIEKNLKSLEKQAKRTQKYFEIKAEYKTISAQFAYLKLRSVRQEQEVVEKETQQLSDALTEVQTHTALKESRMYELKKQLVDNEAAVSEAQQTLNTHIRNLQSAESEKNIKNERLKYLHQRQIALNNQIETEKRQADKNLTEVDLLKKEAEGKEASLVLQAQNEEKLLAEMRTTKEKSDARQQALQAMEREQRDAENEMRQLVREKDMLAVRIKSLESELLRAQEDKDAKEGDLDEFAQKAEDLAAEVQALETELQTLKDKKQAHETALAETETQLNALKDEVYQVSRTLDAKQNEYNLTKSLVDSLEGFPESVKYLKKNAMWIKDAPLLSDIFATQDAYKAVIEQYLEPYLSYYVVDNHADAFQAIDLLTKAAKGRANFFLLDEINAETFTSRGANVGIPALSVIEYAEKYNHLAQWLLKDVYLVENEADFPDNIAEGCVYLQKNGQNIRRKFVQSGGSTGLFEGKRLGRARNLVSLEKEVAELRQKSDSQKKELQTITAKWESLKQVKPSQEIEPLNKKLIEKQRDLQFLSTREKEHREFLHRVGQRAETLHTELTQLRAQLKEVEPEIQHQQVLFNRLTLALGEERETYQTLFQASNTITQQYNQAHIQHIHAKNAVENLQKDIVQKNAFLAQAESNIARMRTELEAVKDDIEQLIAMNHQDDAEILTMHEKKKALESVLNGREQKTAETKNLIRQNEEVIDTARKKSQHIQQQQQAVKDTLTEVRLQLNGLRERMSVEFQIDVDTIDKGVFENAIETYSITEIESQLMKLRNQVQNFGEINPMALEAFEEMQTRFNFVRKQCEDLYEAKRVLLNTISEIDETAKVKFMDTFVAVRENFITVFRSLFTEDDTCDLILSNPENPLESEIDITARPKGKRPLTIAQLSGGEKTLTAVALLFSIYLIKPAPFCIFDEVDAPLDDANIDKFNNIIRRFSEGSQFIIVTHNKRTMASTRVMYGITMEDLGISRMLPVSLEALNLN